MDIENKRTDVDNTDSNDEVSKRKCLDCNYDGEDLGNDSCQKCGCRYEPTEMNENCPKCNCGDYDIHCPECDSDNIVYWNDYQSILADGSLL